MELWKIHRYGEHATLEELNRTYQEVSQALLQGRLKGTNGHAALRIVKSYIARQELKKLFKED